MVLGPAEAPLALVRGRYRFRLLVKTERNVDLQALSARLDRPRAEGARQRPGRDRCRPAELFIGRLRAASRRGGRRVAGRKRDRATVPGRCPIATRSGMALATGGGPRAGDRRRDAGGSRRSDQC